MFANRLCFLRGAAVVVWLMALAAAGEEPVLFPAASHAEAWRRLPATVAGGQEPLPAWARVLAPSLPGATAAMLEMDRQQRQESTLSPQLRARVRWQAARANGCRYAEQYALFDYERAGGSLAELERGAPADTREARLDAFVRRLCREGYAVSDSEVEALLADLGPQDLTAAVLAVAYGCFQDRLLLSLQVEVEPDGPLPPPAMRFDWEQFQKHPPERAKRADPAALPPVGKPVPTGVDDLRWAAQSHDDVRLALKRQQQRAARIPIPSDEVVNRNTPRELASGARASDIRWNAVTFGYQPKLAAAWMFTTRRFREEAGLPAAFRQSSFWVVTRANQCFY